MVVTSVRGHMMDLEFPPHLKSWNAVNPAELFAAPVSKIVKSDSQDISKTLKEHALLSQMLILWLDCDREGENIAYEVHSDQRLLLPLGSDVEHAIFNLAELNAGLSEPYGAHTQLLFALPPHICVHYRQAVDCRQELDLRIGAAVTRFLTLRYQTKYNLPTKVISFGPCQFPTLGFVVERFKAHESFISEPFWSLKLRYVPASAVQGNSNDDGYSSTSKPVDFLWDRGKLFDRIVVEVFKTICERGGIARTVSVNGRPVSKRKPLPLTSRKLQMTSKMCMQIAESLYQRGLISYPRTETNSFTPTMNLKELVEIQKDNREWGEYATKLADQEGFRQPYSGRNNDNAHPPIHPVKNCDRSSFANEHEWKVFDLICRHFLACVSDDAKGQLTQASVELGGELFHASGLLILDRNFLEVYHKFDQWSGQQLPPLTPQAPLPSTRVEMSQGKTEPPPLLTEADLIKKMDQFGIGTDATMHEHIQTIQDRLYAEKFEPSSRFRPSVLGLSLVEGFRKYTRSFMDLSKPDLRAKMEANMALIAVGRQSKEEVIKNSLNEIATIYRLITTDPTKFDTVMASYFGSGERGGASTLPSATTASLFNVPARELLLHVVLTQTSLCRCGGFMDVRTPAMPTLVPLTTRRGGRGNSRRGGRRAGDLTASDPVSQQKKYLVCQSNHSCPILPLPRKGIFSSHRHTCPACGYQVLKVANPDTSTSYFLCPYCFSHASSDLFGTSGNLRQPPSSAIENLPQGQLRCFLCCHPVRVVDCVYQPLCSSSDMCISWWQMMLDKDVILTVCS